MDPLNWFVIETKSEFCTVCGSDVLCEENVAVGETVEFFWTKSKKYEGIIRFIHVDYDECMAEIQRLVSMAKSQPKPNSSFHEDRPRKSAQKYKDSLKRGKDSGEKSTAVKAKKVKSSKGRKDPVLENKMTKVSNEDLLEEAKKSSQPQNKLQPIYDTDSGSDSKETCGDPFPSVLGTLGHRSSLINMSFSKFGGGDATKGIGNQASSFTKSIVKPTSSVVVKTSPKEINQDSGSSTEPLSESSLSDSEDDLIQNKTKEQKKTRKLALALASKFDVSLLSKLARGENPFASSSTLVKENAGEGLKKTNGSVASVSKEASSKTPKSDCKESDEQPSCSSNNEKKKLESNSKKSKPADQNGAVPMHQVHGVNNAFEGEMFACDADSSDAVELFPDSKIYCLKLHFDKAEASSTTTMYARRCLEGVFSKDALSKCSISGLPPRGKGKEAYQDPGVIKPFLDPKAINAIVSQAKAVQKKRHFVKKRDETQIRQAMAVKLREFQK